jgi:hypothetical protein
VPTAVAVTIKPYKSVKVSKERFLYFRKKEQFALLEQNTPAKDFNLFSNLNL